MLAQKGISLLHKNSKANSILIARAIVQKDAICFPIADGLPLHCKFQGTLSANTSNAEIQTVKILFVSENFKHNNVIIPALAFYRWKKEAAKSLFDKTCGYPGEGPRIWSKMEPQLRMATWNSRSLTQERFQYCKNLQFDVLALTELWRSAEKFADVTCQWTFSAAEKDASGNPKFPEDRAAGVGILLSERATRKCIAHGSPCERITWVKLKGPVVDLFCIAVYMPHRMRSHPSQSDTAATLMSLLSKIPKNDCIIVLGDMNEQLPANIKGHTGKWSFGEASLEEFRYRP